MVCERCRELVSARLDGETRLGEDPDAHLATCTACRAWSDRAAAVTRLARTGPAATPPDRTAAVVAAVTALPAVTRRRRAAVTVRTSLALVGVGQLVLAAVGVLGVAAAGHGGMHGAMPGMPGMPGMTSGGVDAAHTAHETAAWNLALGIGFLAVSWAGGRLVAGLLPVTGAFVAVLAVLSALDLAAGRVEPGRLATHTLVVVGFLLLLWHRRVLGDGGGRAGRPERSAPAAAPVAPAVPWPGPASGPGAVAEDRRAA